MAVVRFPAVLCVGCDLGVVGHVCKSRGAHSSRAVGLHSGLRDLVPRHARDVVIVNGMPVAGGRIVVRVLDMMPVSVFGGRPRCPS